MKKVLLIILLFIANYSNAQIVRDNFKLMKEQFIFVDTITIDNPIIIIYDYKIPYGPADAIEYLDVEGFFFFFRGVSR